MKNRIEFLAKFIYESELLSNHCPNYQIIKEGLERNNNNGHIGTILYLEKRAKEKENPLSEFDIKKAHELIFKGSSDWQNKFLPEEAVGNYRKNDFIIGELNYELIGIPAHLIPQQMKNLIRTINKYQFEFFCYNKKIPLEIISDFHYHFLIISPFHIGNGRLNRTLFFYLMKYFEKEPFLIQNKDKEQYFSAFITKSPEALYEYFFKKTERK